MLTALMLVGLASAVAVPAMVMALSEADGDAEDTGEDAGDLPADDPDIGAVAHLDADEGAIYDVPARPGDISFETFVPGSDTLVLRVDDPLTAFSTEPGEEGGVRLAYAVDGQAATISFPHLEALPVADIDIVVSDPDEDALSPADGETPDEPPADASATSGLAPGDGDAVSEPPDPAPDTGAPLSPVSGDLADTAPEGDVAEFENFAAGEDQLVITLIGGDPDNPPPLTIRAMDGGAGFVIAVDGATVAHLPGAADVTDADVRLRFAPEDP